MYSVPAIKRGFDEHWAKNLAGDAVLIKTIVADGQIAGHIASFMRDGKRKVGYWIDRTLWGRSIMSQALLHFSAWNSSGRSTPA